MFGSRSKRRRELRQKRLSGQWLKIIDKNVPYFKRLTPEDQLELQGLVHVFLDEKHFEGCGGLKITDEIRVIIATQACVLLLHRETQFYPKLHSILVYPHAYIVKGIHRQDGRIVNQGMQVRLGESWEHGSVVLAWDAVLGGASDVHDGRNVVFHEFAHQLDQENSLGPGAPLLPKRSMYLAWARVLGHEYQELHDALDHHRKTLIDPYGATNPAEFFAVVSECFFEKSERLKRLHPELYKQLKVFYRQDPATLYGS